MDRRQVIGGLAVATGGLVFSSALADGHSNHLTSAEACLSQDGGSSSRRFPQHAMVFDHHGRKLRFYNDLIKNKVVMMHFMSTNLEQDFHTAKNLAKMQTILGDRLGKNFFLYSITVDPENDTPEVLAKYAARHNAGAGWLFLSGYNEDMQAIRDALFFRPQGHKEHHGSHEGQDCSLGLIRYGNEAAGLWGAVPTSAAPEWIAGRLSWIQSRTLADVNYQQTVRRGPPALNI